MPKWAHVHAMDRKYGPKSVAFAILEALVISWALIFLAENFGWQLVREAGGNTLQDNRKPLETVS
jgi:hypothetical protein